MNHDQVQEVMANYPDAMVHESAGAVIAEKRLLPVEVAWICASFELSKPKIHKRSLSEILNTRDAVG